MWPHWYGYILVDQRHSVNTFQGINLLSWQVLMQLFFHKIVNLSTELPIYCSVIINPNFCKNGYEPQESLGSVGRFKPLLWNGQEPYRKRRAFQLLVPAYPESRPAYTSCSDRLGHGRQKPLYPSCPQAKLFSLWSPNPDGYCIASEKADHRSGS